MIKSVIIILTIVQAIPYIYSMLWGTTKPSRVSYGIWLIEAWALTLTYIAAGGISSAWVFITLTGTTTIVFLLTLRPDGGYWSRSKSDIIAGTVGILAIIIWPLAGPTASVFILITVGIAAYIPTIRKSWDLPNSENLLSWSILFLANLLNLFTITSTKLVIVLPPVISFLCPLLVVNAIIIGKIRSNNKKSYEMDLKREDYN